MPLLKVEKIADSITLYGWMLTESVDELKLLCHQEGLSVDSVSGVKADSRRKELLAEKLLVNQAFGAEAELAHHDDGSPFVKNTACDISITHTRSFVGLVVSGIGSIGIDAEDISPRVLKVRDKFMSTAEKQMVADTDVMTHLLVWTAKEAVYKVAGVEGIDFSEDIVVALPFKADSHDCWLRTSSICSHNGDSSKHYEVLTRIIDDRVLTMALCVKNDIEAK